MKPRAACALLLGALLVASLAAAPSALGAYMKGMDISNHQGNVRWFKVPDRMRFAFVKATEGVTYLDPWYLRNRRGAHRRNIAFGAYHFARPDGTTVPEARRDGRAEARYFHRYARPRRGELRPVLDLEVTGGLPPELLKPWTRAFLRALERRVGAKPMIYTSPLFWESAMGDTEWFANNGYRVLWIAHWQTRRPSVPAENWGGRGWTFWQFTSCGRVKGIEGCVDKNKYRHRSLRRVTIR